MILYKKIYVPSVYSPSVYKVSTEQAGCRAEQIKNCNEEKTKECSKKHINQVLLRTIFLLLHGTQDLCQILVLGWILILFFASLMVESRFNRGKFSWCCAVNDIMTVTFNYLWPAFWKRKRKRHFLGGSGSGSGSNFWKSPGSGSTCEKKIGSGSGSDFKKIWVEAEAEAIFFSLWKRKRKLLNSSSKMEAEVEAVKNFWKF